MTDIKKANETIVTTDVKGKQLKNFAIGAAVFIGASNILYYLVLFGEDIVDSMSLNTIF